MSTTTSSETETDTKRPNNEDQRHPGQQSILRYMRREEKMKPEMEEIDPEIAKLKTSDIITTAEGKRRLIVIGSDVVALFPSLTDVETGKDCEQQVLKSPIKIDGADYFEMARYCSGNRKLAGDLSEVEHLLPWRRNRRGGGVEPGMQNI